MNFAYLIRLLCLGAACFFLLHLAAGSIVAASTQFALRMAQRMDTRRAARFLFAIRLLPTVFAGVVVTVFCVPSYIVLEPNAEVEGVGVVCFAAAALGAVLWGISIARSWRAIAQAARVVRNCRRLTGNPEAVWVVEKPAPVLIGLAGVLRPRFIVSSEALTLLSPEQLELALLHERAHRVSHDNLKRLLVMLTPDLLPWVNPWRALERNWARFTEWAADDAAAGGDAGRALSLATALVSVARAGASKNPSPLLASFADPRAADLEARVDRLLEPSASRPGSGRWFSALSFAAVWALVGCVIVALATQPAVLDFTHEVMERLIAD